MGIIKVMLEKCYTHHLTDIMWETIYCDDFSDYWEMYDHLKNQSRRSRYTHREYLIAKIIDKIEHNECDIKSVLKLIPKNKMLA